MYLYFMYTLYNEKFISMYPDVQTGIFTATYHRHFSIMHNVLNVSQHLLSYFYRVHALSSECNMYVYILNRKFELQHHPGIYDYTDSG
jgi:hypothetical protein